MAHAQGNPGIPSKHLYGSGVMKIRKLMLGQYCWLPVAAHFANDQRNAAMSVLPM
jgi:hypothetical protein